jgi:Domain of unknown function (DUF4372)
MEAGHVHRHTGLRTIDGAFAVAHIPALRGRYRVNRKVRRFSCLEWYLCMAFAQLTYCKSLCDVEACLRAQRSKLYHMGISCAYLAAPLLMPMRCGGTALHWRIHSEFA